VEPPVPVSVKAASTLATPVWEAMILTWYEPAARADDAEAFIAIAPVIHVPLGELAVKVAAIGAAVD
jgi:hypothetical protein